MVSDKSFPTFVALIKAHFYLTPSFPLRGVESAPLLDYTRIMNSLSVSAG